MKKMEAMKRILSLVLCFVMVFGMLPVNAFATDTEEAPESAGAPVVVLDEEPGEEPVEEPGEEPSEEPVEEPGEEPVEEPVEEPAEEPVEEPGEEPAEEPGEEPAEEPGEEPVEEPGEEPGEEPVEEPAEEPGEEPVVVLEEEPVGESSEEPAEEQLQIVTQTAVFRPDASGLPSDEELFVGYAANVLYGTDFETFDRKIRDSLTGDVALAYDALVPVIHNIAAGKRESTSIIIGQAFEAYDEGELKFYPVDREVTFAGEPDEAFLQEMVNALLADMPFYLYWYDKTSCYTGMRMRSAGDKRQIVLEFPVAQAYSAGTYMTDTAKTGAAASAASAALAVVKSAENMSDYDKLVYYKDYICSQVSFDHSAADKSTNTPYGDPWQVISVFDEDSSTNVVCEGYAKAYWYLCDLTAFEGDIACYSVTGSAGDPHMWNIVSIDGSNYMVDITNTDDHTNPAKHNFGQLDGCVFLAGCTNGNVDDGYTFTNKNEGTLTYLYSYVNDEGVLVRDALDTFTREELTLAEEDYTPPAEGGEDENVPAVPMTQEALASAMIATPAGEPYRLTQSVDITNNMEMTSTVYVVGEDTVLTVKEGVTVTVPEDCHLVSQEGGHIVLEENANIVVYGMLVSDRSHLEANAGSRIENHGMVIADNGPIHLKEGSQMDNTSFVNVMGGSIQIDGTFNHFGDGQMLIQNNSSVTVGGTLNISGNGYVEVNGTMTVNSGAKLAVDPSEGNCGFYVNGTLNVDTGADITDLAAKTIQKHEHASVSGIADKLLYMSYYPGNTAEMKAALSDIGDGTKYGFAEMVPSVSFSITESVTIPDNALLQLWSMGTEEEPAAVTVTVPEGVTLTNNGHIIINDLCTLIVEGGLVNNTSITVKSGGVLRAMDTLSGAGGIDGDGTVITDSQMTHEELAAMLAAANGTANTVELYSKVTLTADLDTSMGVNGASLDILEGGCIVVPNGKTLTIYNPVTLKGGKIIVENGGNLMVSGGLDSREGTVYIAEGGSYEASEAHYVDGRITFHDQTDAYLSGRWLDHRDGEGLFENFDQSLDENAARGCGNMGHANVIFYLNEWDEENLQWSSRPVIPEAPAGSNYTITKMRDIPEETICDGEPNADYFVQVRAFGGIAHEDTRILVGDLEFEYFLWSRDVAFYTTAVVSPESIIDNGEFILDANKDENAFYLLLLEPDNRSIENFDCQINTHGQDYNAFVPENEKFIDYKPIENGYKFTIHPDYVNYVQYDWKNFNVSVFFDLTDKTSDDSESRDLQIWVNAPETPEPKARLGLNGHEYQIYDTDVVFRDVFNGQEWVSEKTELPSGVSYDVSNNILTLTRANLDTLRVRSWELPSKNLTIDLVDSSSIHCNDDGALNIEGDLNVTITSAEGANGGLMLSAENNYNKDHEGNAYAFPTVSLGNGSSLTIGGHARVSVTNAGEGRHGGGEDAWIHCICGDWEGTSSLTVTDDASLEVSYTKGTRRHDDTNDYGGGYSGIENVRNITVSGNGSLTADMLYVKDDYTFTQTGGSVTIRSIGGIWVDEQRNPNVMYEGIFVEGGKLNISGGTMKIQMVSQLEDPNPRINGIKLGWDGVMNLSGGSVTINNGGLWGCSMIVADQSHLNMTGGTLDVSNGTEEGVRETLSVAPEASASFLGGTITADRAVVVFAGDVTWGREGMGTTIPATGTAMTGTPMAVITPGSGTFNMYGGSITMTATDMDMDNEGEGDSRVYFEANGSGNIFGGTITINNGEFRGNMNTGLSGGKIEISNDREGITGLIVNNYMPINSGILNVTANKAAAIYVSGTYHQMGGTVTAKEILQQLPAMVSEGTTLVSNGTLNLTGGNTFVQSYRADRAEEGAQFRTQFTGGTVNIDAARVGMIVDGPVHLTGNADITITAKSACTDDRRTWPYAIFVERFTGQENNEGENMASLLVDGQANVKLISTDISEPNHSMKSKGIGLLDAPMHIAGGTVTIESEMAIYSISYDENQTNLNNQYINFSTGTLETQTFAEAGITEGDGFIHSPMDGDEYVGNVTMTVKPMTQSELEEKLEGEEDIVLDVPVILERNLDIAMYGHELRIVQGGMIKVPEEVSLTISGNVRLPGGTLYAMEGGTITVTEGTRLQVEGGLLYAASGGKFVVEQGAYVQMPGGRIEVLSGGTLENGGTIYHNGEMVLAENSYVNVENGFVRTYFNGDNLCRTENVPYQHLEMEGGLWENYQLRNILEEAAKGYRHVKIMPNGGEYVFDQDAEIPENVEIPFANSGIHVREGAELTVNGDVTLNWSELILDEGTSLINNRSIFLNNGSEMKVNGTVENHADLHVGYYKDGNVEGPAGRLQVSGYLENDGYLQVAKEGVLDIHQELKNIVNDNGNTGYLNVYGTVNVHENGKLNTSGLIDLCDMAAMTIYQGGQMTIDTNELRIEENSLLVVRDGGMLTNNHHINNGGTIIVVNQENYYQIHENAFHGNDIVFENDMAPYMMFSWISWDKNGAMYESNDTGREFSLPVDADRWMVFHRVEWNKEDYCWMRTPIDPIDIMVINDDETEEPYLQVTAVRDYEDMNIQEGQPNAGYFARVWARDGWDKTVTLSYKPEDANFASEMQVRICREEGGFYRSTTIDNANWLNGIEVNPFGENVFYFGFDSTFWDLEHVRMADEHEHLGTLEMLSENIYKCTLSSEAAQNIWQTGDFDFNVAIIVSAKNEPTRMEEWNCGIRCMALDPHDYDAKLVFNDQEYYYHHEKGYIVNDRETGRPVVAQLPENVSYDYERNTLTLSGAELDNISLNGESWTDEHGNRHGDLPNRNLTIVLEGTNTISSIHTSALSLHDISATITSKTGGSLTLKSDNKNNFNYDENGEKHVYAFDTVDINGDLTIAGNAVVTAEIDGTGVREIWENDEYLGNQRARLAALRVNEGTLTLKDSAKLTTVLPEGARGSGDKLGEDEPLIWEDWFPGGYKGIENAKSVIVQGSAVLNTQRLELRYADGGYTQTGGTVTITDVGSSDEQELWENGEQVFENGEPVIVTMTRYRGLVVGGGKVSASGGNLDIYVHTRESDDRPTFCGINAENGSTVTIGGSAAVTIHGTGIGTAVQVYQNSKLNLTGGTLNVEGPAFDGRITKDAELPVQAMYVGDGATMTLSGTTLNFANADVVLDCPVKMSGGNLNMNKGRLWICGIMDQTGGNVNLENCHVAVETDPEHTAALNLSKKANFALSNSITMQKDDYQMLFRVDENSALNITGGTMTLTGSGYNDIVEICGGFSQSGGTLTVTDPAEEQTAAAIMLRNGGSITGGTIDLDAYVGLAAYVDLGGVGENGEAYEGLTKADARLDITSGIIEINSIWRGIELCIPAEISGGRITIDVTGRMVNNGVQNGPVGMGIIAMNTNQSVTGSLDISGGEIIITTPDGAVLPEGCTTAYGAGIFGGQSKITINGGLLELKGTEALAAECAAETVDAISIGEHMMQLDVETGAVPKLVYIARETQVDEDNTVFWQEVQCQVDGKEVRHMTITPALCGDSAYWSFDSATGTLHIEGSGPMENYTSAAEAPWHDVRGFIKTVVLGEEITGIGAYAFANCGALNIEIGEQISVIGENAFQNCSGTNIKAYHNSGDYLNANGITGVTYLGTHVLTTDANGDLICFCGYKDTHVEEQMEEALKQLEENESGDQSAPVTVAQKVEAIKEVLDTESMKVAMEHAAVEGQTNAVAEKIIELEEEQKDAGKTLEIAVPEFDDTATEEAKAVQEIFKGVSDENIVGALLNHAENTEAPDGGNETAQTVKLVVEIPEVKPEIDETAYNAETAVAFSMTLEGVNDASNLDVPVTMTLSVPASFADITKLTILHYHGDAEPVELDYVLSGTEGSYSVTFVLTGFSDFVFVETELDAPIEEPVGIISDVGRTLSLDGIVYINQYVKVEGIDKAYAMANGGLLIWKPENGKLEEEDAVFGTQKTLVEGLLDKKLGLTQQTPGIPACEYADTLYLRVYVRTEENEYIYGPLKSYSVREYCENRLKNSTDEKMKDTCAAMLHYGAAAQINFDYNTGDLANKNVQRQIPGWNQSLLDAPLDPITLIRGTGTIQDGGKSLNLTGAVSVNFYFKIDESVGTPKKAEVLIWHGETGELTLENADYRATAKISGDKYKAKSNMVPARYLGETIYACAHFVAENGEDHYSDVVVYSPEKYAANKIEANANQPLIATMKAMVLYGELADTYFASKES